MYQRLVEHFFERLSEKALLASFRKPRQLLGIYFLSGDKLRGNDLLVDNVKTAVLYKISTLLAFLLNVYL